MASNAPPSSVETLPDGTRIEFWDSEDADGNPQQRRYMVNGQRFANVTTILNVLAKDALLDWAANLAKEGLEWKKVRAEAGERGRVSHHLLLQVLTGAGASLADLSEEHRPYGQAGFKWFRDRKPEVIEVEHMVASCEHRYAGRLDLFADIDGAKTLIDFKTVTKWSYQRDRKTGELTNRLYPPYDENLLQLDLYQGARVECGLPPAEQGLVVRLGPDAEYDETFVDLAPPRGVAILRAYRAKAAATKALRGASTAAHNARVSERGIAEAVKAA
jgi:hypothetical protein